MRRLPGAPGKERNSSGACSSLSLAPSSLGFPRASPSLHVAQGQQLAGYSSGFLVHGANDTGVLDMATWSPAAPGTHPLHPAAAHFYQPCSGRGSRDNRTQKMGGREEMNQERKGGERKERHTQKKSGKGKARAEGWRQEPLLLRGARGFKSMLLTTISKQQGCRAAPLLAQDTPAPCSPLPGSPRGHQPNRSPPYLFCRLRRPKKYRDEG